MFDPIEDAFEQTYGKGMDVAFHWSIRHTPVWLLRSRCGVHPVTVIGRRDGGFGVEPTVPHASRSVSYDDALLRRRITKAPAAIRPPASSGIVAGSGTGATGLPVRVIVLLPKAAMVPKFKLRSAI